MADKPTSGGDRIDLKGVRASLTVRGEPYWRRLGKGCALGYRQSVRGGAWIARWTDTNYCYHQKKLGSADELTYEDAVRAAQVWFTQCRGGVIRSGTVAEACKLYVENQRNEKGARSADYSEKLYFQRLVYEKPFGEKPLDKLTTRDVLAWRNELQADRRKNSANRALRSLKAALSFAFRAGMCPDDSAWRRVEAFRGPDAADQARAAYLTPRQRSLLLAACSDDDLANLLRGLLHTAARPLSNAELPAAKVADFDPMRKSLTLRSYKGDGTERRREVPLSESAVAFFKAMSKSKLPGAYLFTCGGYPWARHEWSKGIRAAVAAANAKIAEPAERLPTDTCAYTMRHCAISDRLQAGVNLSRVAKDAGTSVAMIERYYAKFVDDADLRVKLASIEAF